MISPGLALLLVWLPSCCFAQWDRSLLEVPPASLAIALNSSEGVSILTNSKTLSSPYWKTAALHLITQMSQSYCAIASAVTILNGLEISRGSAPIDPAYDPYAYWTQENIFNNCTNEVITPAFISTHGVTMDQLSAILACHNISSDVVHSNETSLQGFRNTIITKMKGGNPILLNFHRPELGEHGGGHFSPIVAYSAGHDRALLVDVSRYKYPPTWVHIADLYNASLTMDHTAMKYRGVVLVTDTDSSDSAPEDSNTPSPPTSQVFVAIIAVLIIVALFFSSLVYKYYYTYFSFSSMYSNLRTADRDDYKPGFDDLSVGACGVDGSRDNASTNTINTMHQPMQNMQNQSSSHGVIRFDRDDSSTQGDL